MSQLIDFAEARNRVSLEEVFSLISYKPIYYFGWNTYGPCPICRSRHLRCCSFELSRGLWKCHYCDKGGNQLDLYAAWADLPLYDAVLAIFRLLGRDIPFKT